MQHLRLLYRHMRVAAIGSALPTLAVAALLWQVTPKTPLMLWAGAGMAIAIARVALAGSRRRGATDAALPTWQRGYLAGAALSGLNWGALSVFMFPTDSIAHQVFLAFVLSGVTAGSASVHGAARGGFLLFAVPAVLPLGVQFALQGSALGHAMMGMAVVFLIVMALASREINRTVGDVLELQVENLELTRALHHQATHDSLVDLVNHGEFKRRLEALATIAAVRHEPYALIFVDLDLFKDVNDRGGHAAGDEMLRQIGAILRGKVRDQDTTARLGGDEFGILLARCPPDSARRVAEEVLQGISAFELTWAGQSFRIGASVGVAYTTAGEYDAATLLHAADAACYAAKEAGGNQIRMFHSDPSFSATGRFNLSRI